MTLKNKTTKSIALALATTFAFTAIIPMTAAQAHPRNSPNHGGSGKIIKQPVSRSTFKSEATAIIITMVARLSLQVLPVWL